jgi:MGS-like domain
MTQPRRALLSVFDKRGLIDFAHGLAACGFELISTGGTFQALRNAGLDVVATDGSRRSTRKSTAESWPTDRFPSTARRSPNTTSRRSSSWS